MPPRHRRRRNRARQLRAAGLNSQANKNAPVNPIAQGARTRGGMGWQSGGLNQLVLPGGAELIGPAAVGGRPPIEPGTLPPTIKPPNVMGPAPVQPAEVPQQPKGWGLRQAGYTQDQARQMKDYFRQQGYTGEQFRGDVADQNFTGQYEGGKLVHGTGLRSGDPMNWYMRLQQQDPAAAQRLGPPPQNRSVIGPGGVAQMSPEMIAWNDRMHSDPAMQQYQQAQHFQRLQGSLQNMNQTRPAPPGMAWGYKNGQMGQYPINDPQADFTGQGQAFTPQTPAPRGPDFGGPPAPGPVQPGGPGGLQQVPTPVPGGPGGMQQAPEGMAPVQATAQGYVPPAGQTLPPPNTPGAPGFEQQQQAPPLWQPAPGTDQRGVATSSQQAQQRDMGSTYNPQQPAQGGATLYNQQAAQAPAPTPQAQQFAAQEQQVQQLSQQAQQMVQEATQSPGLALPLSPEFEAGRRAIDDQLSAELAQIGAAREEIPAMLNFIKERLATDEAMALRGVREAMSERGMLDSSVTTRNLGEQSLGFDRTRQDLAMDTARQLRELMQAESGARAGYGRSMAELLMEVARNQAQDERAAVRQDRVVKKRADARKPVKRRGKRRGKKKKGKKKGKK